MLLKYAENKYLERLGHSHHVVILLDSLANVLSYLDSHEFSKYTLDLGFSSTVDTLGEAIGTDHAVLLNMWSHHEKIGRRAYKFHEDTTIHQSTQQAGI